MKQNTEIINGVTIISANPIPAYWATNLWDFLSLLPYKKDIDHINFTLDYYDEESGLMNLTFTFKDMDHPMTFNKGWNHHKQSLENALEDKFIDEGLAILRNASFSSWHSGNTYSSTMVLTLIF